MSAPGATPPPFLRTLAPLLRSLERRLREWLDARRRYPVSLVARAEVEGLAEDLKRKADGLDIERPVLVVMLMGGTGVGKSTLMNALAGSSVAQASYTRPTTRDPVVYFHQSVKPDRLCTANNFVYCRCANLAEGTKQCSADSTKFSNCDCGDTSGGPAALALSLVIGTVILRSRRRKVT